MLGKLLTGVRRTCWRIDNLPEVANSVGIWGAGSRGRSLRHALLERNVQTDFFIDNDEFLQDELVDGVIVLPLEMLDRKNTCPVFITVEVGYPMARRLRRMGFEDIYFINNGYTCPPFPVMEYEEDILRVYHMLKDEESRTCYLAAIKMRETGTSAMVHPSPYPQNKHPQVKAAPGDILINAGGYLGYVAANFTRLTARNCTVFSFEPCPVLFSKMSANFESWGISDIAFPVRKALWKERGMVSFSMDTPHQGNSRVVPNEGELIEGIDLDSFVAERGLPCVNLIELDVEGGEPDALIGATEVIKRHKPKLQISLYHDPRHLWELPLWVKRLVPDYTFYIGHHQHAFNETMLYAIVK